MALSSLESIKEKLDEVKKQKLEDILAVSGSNAIARDVYGITTVNDDDVSSSLIFKTLKNQKLNNQEILKSLNPAIKELKPKIPAVRKDLVPKPLYDEQVKTNEDLRKQIDGLNNRISILNDNVSRLTSEVELEINNRLAIEQTNDVLTNQSQVLTATIDDFIGQIQSSLQKSIEESVLRASLQAQNTGFRAQIEALIKQIDSLNSIIEGLQSQLGAVQQQQAIQQSSSNLAAASGGDVINKIAVVTFEPKTTNPSDAKIYGMISSKGDKKWIYGGSITITNNDTAAVKVNLNASKWPDGTDNKKFFKIPETEFNIAPNQNKKITFTLDEKAAKFLDSQEKGGLFGGHTESKIYRNGRLSVTVTRTTDNSSESKTFETGLNKVHPKSFE